MAMMDKMNNEGDQVDNSATEENEETGFTICIEVRDDQTIFVGVDDSEDKKEVGSINEALDVARKMFEAHGDMGATKGEEEGFAKSDKQRMGA